MITTYDTLASDFTASGGEQAFVGDGAAAAGDKRKRRHGVMSLGWHRVVLDEAHTIRNNKTIKHKVGGEGGRERAREGFYGMFWFALTRCRSKINTTRLSRQPRPRPPPPHSRHDVRKTCLSPL